MFPFSKTNALNVLLNLANNKPVFKIMGSKIVKQVKIEATPEPNRSRCLSRLEQNDMKYKEPYTLSLSQDRDRTLKRLILRSPFLSADDFLTTYAKDTIPLRSLLIFDSARGSRNSASQGSGSRDNELCMSDPTFDSAESILKYLNTDKSPKKKKLRANLSDNQNDLGIEPYEERINRFLQENKQYYQLFQLKL